eukprot:TRINITY_DN41946_c0_g1_i1.p1 TRINITY_DN41946_c0_g1~~TRINITY_DN41946_c0_g1_i1.p1  ORF type:complete len:684 (+),score=119.49 TRINITY_DN41946_c0_g1_i1:166-2217(+)
MTGQKGCRHPGCSFLAHSEGTFKGFCCMRCEQSHLWNCPPDHGKRCERIRASTEECDRALGDSAAFGTAITTEDDETHSSYGQRQLPVQAPPDQVSCVMGSTQGDSVTAGALSQDSTSVGQSAMEEQGSACKWHVCIDPATGSRCYFNAEDPTDRFEEGDEAWQRYCDPESSQEYFWRDDSAWFWLHDVSQQDSIPGTPCEVHLSLSELLKACSDGRKLHRASRMQPAQASTDDNRSSPSEPSRSSSAVTVMSKEAFHVLQQLSWRLHWDLDLPPAELLAACAARVRSDNIAMLCRRLHSPRGGQLGKMWGAFVAQFRIPRGAMESQSSETLLHFVCLAAAECPEAFLNLTGKLWPFEEAVVNFAKESCSQASWHQSAASASNGEVEARRQQSTGRASYDEVEAFLSQYGVDNGAQRAMRGAPPNVQAAVIAGSRDLRYARNRSAMLMSMLDYHLKSRSADRYDEAEQNDARWPPYADEGGSSEDAWQKHSARRGNAHKGDEPWASWSGGNARKGDEAWANWSGEVARKNDGHWASWSEDMVWQKYPAEKDCAHTCDGEASWSEDTAWPKHDVERGEARKFDELWATSSQATEDTARPHSVGEAVWKPKKLAHGIEEATAADRLAQSAQRLVLSELQQVEQLEGFALGPEQKRALEEALESMRMAQQAQLLASSKLQRLVQGF